MNNDFLDPIEALPELPKFSRLLINIFPDGTVEYEGETGPPEDFPLTEAERAEVDSALATLVS
jgi:hypothetical protein